MLVWIEVGLYQPGFEGQYEGLPTPPSYDEHTAIRRTLRGPSASLTYIQDPFAAVTRAFIALAHY